MNLTDNQKEFLHVTQPLVGQISFYVATSQYANSRATGYWNDFITTTTSQTLKGLEAKGFIKIVDKFWRGAEVVRVK